MLSNLRFYTDKTVDLITANQIKPIVLDFLDSKPPRVDTAEWLNSTNVMPGLEQRLANISVGSTCEITVGFRNKWTISGEEIIADKNDTEKAIYRLSLIGVVDDYTIDYNTKTFTLKLRKKTDEEYVAYMRAYIRQYYSETRTEEAIARFLKNRVPKQSLVKDGLRFLVDFVYREIEKKRRLGIDVMREACYKGLENDGSTKFREFLDLYFNSKYARTDYRVDGENKSLADRTDNGIEENIRWVWEFIEVVNVDKSGSQLDNLKHLRGACTRLLITNPDNTTLLLLRAFALFILEIDNSNDKMIDDAKKDFSQGFSQIADTSTEAELNDNLRKYKDLLSALSQNPKLDAVIADLIDSLGIGDLGEKFLALTTTLHTFTQLLPQYGYEH